ncbi:MAG: tetratricopeptide repeat protein [Hydrogenophilus sp.]|nr:tetratricopeptide repeat protein [Hydrogenophilus sp.]
MRGRGTVAVQWWLRGRVQRWIERLLQRWGIHWWREAWAAAKAREGRAEGWQRLAQAALARGDLTAAARCAQEAVALAPEAASVWVTLAAVLRRQEEWEKAREALEKALAANPRYPPALTNLAEIEIQFGRAEEGLRLLEEALAADPDLLVAQVNRVAALAALDRGKEALAVSEPLVRAFPECAEVQLNHAAALLADGRGREALKYLRRALELNPQMVEAQFTLAALVGDSSRMGAAIEYLEKRLARGALPPPAMALLADAHRAQGHLARARELALTVVKLQPENLSARMTLQGLWASVGHPEWAYALMKQLYEERPDLAGLQSNLLFTGTYLPHLPPEELFAKHEEWAAVHRAAVAAALAEEREHRRKEEKGSNSGRGEKRRRIDRAKRREGTKEREKSNEGAKGKRIRVGLVSGDFNRHPVGQLLMNVVPHFAAEGIDCVAFSTSIRGDDFTEAMRPHFSAWYEVFEWEDRELAEEVEREKIDLLIDLSGHTAFNRLPLFFRRPAAVQATWLGYFHSTGMREIDYIFTDPYTSPPECGQLFSEIPIYLGTTRFCFFPSPHAPEPIAVPPVWRERGRGFTFGCFNRLDKLDDEVVAAWGEILRQTPGSRLWLRAWGLGDGWVRNDLLARFAAEGIGEERLVLRPGGSHEEMLREFLEIDLCLDPFPFSGGATSFDSLWMGVPVLTVPGRTMVSRQSYAMLANVGWAELFAAKGVRDYVARAVGFAREPWRLVAARQTLRARLAASPLVDGKRFVRTAARAMRGIVAAQQRGERLAPFTLFEG